MSNNIKPSKYPVNPDEQTDLFDQAVTAGRAGKQDTLVSGTNLKTVNGNSLLGSGDVTISGNASWGNITGTISSQVDLQNSLNGKQGLLTSGSNIKTINGVSVLGSGNLIVSGSNPRTISNINGNNLIGTSNQISATVTIGSNTLVANNSIYIRSLLTKTAGSTTSTPRLYINTKNSLTGATLIGTGGVLNSTTYIQRFERNFFFDGAKLFCYNPANGIATDLTSGTITLVPFNPVATNYLIFTVQNSTTTPDNLGFKRVIVQVYD